MALYLISYDLRKHRDYSSLYKALQAWKARKLLESLWLAQLLGPADTVANILRTTVDRDDGIAVIELEPGSEWAVIQSRTEGIEWLQTHIDG